MVLILNFFLEVASLQVADSAKVKGKRKSAFVLLIHA